MAMGIAFADDMPSPKNSLQCDQQLDLMLPRFFGQGDRCQKPIQWCEKKSPKRQNNSIFQRHFPSKNGHMSKRDHFKNEFFIFQASTLRWHSLVFEEITHINQSAPKVTTARSVPAKLQVNGSWFFASEFNGDDGMADFCYKKTLGDVKVDG